MADARRSLDDQEMQPLSQEDVHRAARSALRHYVSFSYYARSSELMAAHGGVAPICVCSAFVLKVRDIWCLVTAGHVLDEIEKERAAGIELLHFRLWDGWAVDAQHQNYIPFDFLELPKLRLNRDGYDYGLIPLRPLYVANLRANHVVPIGEEQYAKPWPLCFDGYAMIGTPGRGVSLDRHGKTSVVFSQTTYVIQVAHEPDPPVELAQATPRFYGRLLVDEGSPEWQAIAGDISGMSGGPVLGILRGDDSGMRYWVIGIQSGWLTSRRIIAACYFQEFAKAICALLDEHRGETFRADS